MIHRPVITAMRQLRLHHWVKNLLVFVPLFLSGRVGDRFAVADTIAMFLALGLVASGSYVINDLCDLTSDRLHRSKKHRPIASGGLPIPLAIVMVMITFACGFTLAAAINIACIATLGGYLSLTLCYSFGLKRVPILDVLVIATLFTMRFGIGIAAAGPVISPWLLVFSMFLFTSLSLAKRQAELLRSEGEVIPGRGYRPSDTPLVMALGVATAASAVLVVVLYIMFDGYQQTFFGGSFWLWGFPPIFFLFLSRIWVATHRGQLDDDPILFALRDRSCLLLAILLSLCFMLAAATSLI